MNQYDWFKASFMELEELILHKYENERELLYALGQVQKALFEWEQDLVSKLGPLA